MHILGKDITWVRILLGISVGICILLLAIVTREKIGLGDGMLLTVTGVYLGGADNFQLLMYGLFYAALFSLAVLVVRRWKKSREFPFVPFLFLGYLTMLAERTV